MAPESFMCHVMEKYEERMTEKTLYQGKPAMEQLVTNAIEPQQGL